VADSIKVDNNKAQNYSMVSPINYLLKYYSKPFATLNWQYIPQSMKLEKSLNH